MVEKLFWKNEYSVGVDLLDRQHQGLIALINRLTDVEDDSAGMNRVFDELKIYVKEHFAAEERMLKNAGYPDLKAHHKEHKNFEQWLSAVHQAYSMGATSPAQMAETINAFLRDWLVNHILSSDMAYKDTLDAHGPGKEGATR